METERTSSLAGPARWRVSTAGIRRAAVAVAGTAAVVAGVAGAVLSGRAAVRGARMALDAARLALAALTLRLYRRCPDCRRFVRGDATVCWRCGWRRAGRRWPRPAGRF